MEDSNIVAPEDVSIVDDDERWQETEVEQPTRRPAVSARERRRERTSRVLQNAAAEDKSAARLKHLLVGVFSAVATVAVILGVQVFTGSSGENDDAIAAVDAPSKGVNGKTDTPVSATPEQTSATSSPFASVPATSLPPNTILTPTPSPSIPSTSLPDPPVPGAGVGSALPQPLPSPASVPGQGSASAMVAGAPGASPASPSAATSSTDAATSRPPASPVTPSPSPAIKAAEPETVASSSSLAAPSGNDAPRNASDSDSEKPGRYGKANYSVQIPAGLVLEDVLEEEGRFELEWRTEDTSLDKVARLTFGLMFDSKIVAGSRPPVYNQGGVFPGGEVYIATGGELDVVTIGGATFHKLTYPKGSGETKLKWIMMCHFDGVRVKMIGESSGPAADRLLEKIVTSFSATDPKFSRPSSPSAAGFGSPSVASASAVPAASSAEPRVPSENVAAADSSAMKQDPASSDRFGSDAEEAAWGGTGGGRMLRLKSSPGRSGGAAFSGYPPRFILNRREVLNALNGELVAELPPELEDGTAVISTDGKRVAHFAQSSHEVSVIQVYSCETPDAAPVRIENPEGTWRVDAMTFLDENRLIFHAGEWMIWDSTTGKRLKAFDGSSPNGAGLTFGDNGRYMAVADHSVVLVYDTVRGRVVARMAKVHNGRELNLFWCSGLAFSPDMKELAGLFSDGQFVVWSNKGEVIVDEILADVSKGVGADRPMVFYLPDNSGWFIDGSKLLDRKSMTILWEITNIAWHDVYAAVIDQNTVMTTSGVGSDQDLVFLNIPWDKIRAAQANVDPNEKPLLTRGGAVSLKLNVADIRFADPALTQVAIVEAFQKRLKQSDVTIGDKQPITLVISYSEKNAGQKSVRNFFGGGGTTNVEDTTIVLNVEMRMEGRAEPLWKDELHGDTGLIVDSDLSPQAFRDENFKMIIRQIETLSFPTRISGDGNSSLPVRTGI